MSIKNSNDTTANRTLDLPTCSAVIQTTAPTGAPEIYHRVLSFYARNT